MADSRPQLAIAGALVLATALVGAVTRGGHGTAPGGGVRFGGQLDRKAVLRGRDGTVRMELVIGSDVSPRRDTRVPTDLVVVLDRSGSMAGEKIANARAAVLELVSQLGSDDRFALVTYSNDAELAIPLEAATVDAKRSWTSRIAELAPDGGTNISSGLDVALEAIDASRIAAEGAWSVPARSRVPRAILISDGLANQGDATVEGLTRRAARAARGEYALSTVGVGADFNERLMASLADAGTGNYYYLRGSEDLAAVFAREFGAARTTVASGLAVRIEPADGVEVTDAAGYPLEREGRAVTFRPGALFAGQERRVWVTLRTPTDRVGEHELGRFSLAYDERGERRTVTLDDAPRVACTDAADEFFAAVDVPAWTRSVVVDDYNRMQAEVAASVQDGRRDEAMRRVVEFKEQAGAMNARLRSAPVSAQIAEADKLEREVAAAFDGADQAAKRNGFGKEKSADALDARRAGSK